MDTNPLLSTQTLRKPQPEADKFAPTQRVSLTRDLVIGMAGSGGDGIVSAGESLIVACATEGYHAMMTKSFGSQIRGGESSCRVRLAIEPVLNPGGELDVAVALNWEDFLKFGAELPVDASTIVIYDAATGIAPKDIPLPGISPREVFAVPIGELARKAAGTDKAKNTVVLGLLAGCFGIAREGILSGMRKKLGRKAPRCWRETSGRSRPAWSTPRRIPCESIARWRSRRSRESSCSPTATTSAPRRRSSPAVSSSVVIPSPPRRRSCSS